MAITRQNIPARIRRLQELAGKLYAEATAAARDRVPLKPDEVLAYTRALMTAGGALEDARQVLEKALQRGKPK
jgi:hypothetical protein